MWPSPLKDSPCQPSPNSPYLPTCIHRAASPVAHLFCFCHPSALTFTPSLLYKCNIPPLICLYALLLFQPPCTKPPRDAPWVARAAVAYALYVRVASVFREEWTSLYGQVPISRLLSAFAQAWLAAFTLYKYSSLSVSFSLHDAGRHSYNSALWRRGLMIQRTVLATCTRVRTRPQRMHLYSILRVYAPTHSAYTYTLILRVYAPTHSACTYTLILCVYDPTHSAYTYTFVLHPNLISTGQGRSQAWPWLACSSAKNLW